MDTASNIISKLAGHPKFDILLVWLRLKGKIGEAFRQLETGRGDRGDH